MRFAMIIQALLLAACNNAGEWRNEQAELANELNPPPPPANDTLAAETDYLNAASSEGNEVTTNAADGNDTNAVANEAAPPPAG
jgi:hypothetical protein